jgi:hypothetical protein
MYENGKVLTGDKVTPLRSVIPTPCAWQASLPIFGRGMRTCVVASNNQGENTTKTKKGKTGAKAPIFPFLVEVTR